MITEALRRNVEGAWGAAGCRWLADLPRVLDEVARDWALTVGEPFDLSYHYVVAVTCPDGTPAVLKLGVPSGDSLREEAPALRVFGGRGAEATSIAVGVIRPSALLAGTQPTL